MTRSLISRDGDERCDFTALIANRCQAQGGIDYSSVFCNPNGFPGFDLFAAHNPPHQLMVFFHAFRRDDQLDMLTHSLGGAEAVDLFGRRVPLSDDAVYTFSNHGVF